MKLGKLQATSKTSGASKMSLDDREQQILEEIERQFYEEDPGLARAVRDINRPRRFGIRLPIAGIIVGVVLVIAFFTVNTVVALLGVIVIVGAASALVYELSDRRPEANPEGDEGSGKSPWRRPFDRR